MVPRESPPYLVKFVCWNRNAISLVIQILVGDRPHNLGEGVKLGGRLWYPVKAHHTGHDLLIETDTLSFFV